MTDSDFLSVGPPIDKLENLIFDWIIGGGPLNVVRFLTVDPPGFKFVVSVGFLVIFILDGGLPIFSTFGSWCPGS